MRKAVLVVVFALVAQMAADASAGPLERRLRRLDRKVSRLSAQYPGVAIPAVVVGQPPVPPPGVVVPPPVVAVPAPPPSAVAVDFVGPPGPRVYGFRGPIRPAIPPPVPFGGLTDYSAPIDYTYPAYNVPYGNQGTYVPIEQGVEYIEPTPAAPEPIVPGPPAIDAEVIAPQPAAPAGAWPIQ